MKRVFLATAVAVLASVSASAAENRIRVFVTDSNSWTMGGGWGEGVGAAPQTAEIMKTFAERCSAVTITNNKEKADFVVTLDHEGGKGYARKDNKYAVFNKDGDMIGSGSTRTLGSSVKEACRAVLEVIGQ